VCDEADVRALRWAVRLFFLYMILRCAIQAIVSVVEDRRVVAWIWFVGALLVLLMGVVADWARRAGRRRPRPTINRSGR
jgi:predicted Na+-dependent transporter